MLLPFLDPFFFKHGGLVTVNQTTAHTAPARLCLVKRMCLTQHPKTSDGHRIWTKNSGGEELACSPKKRAGQPFTMTHVKQ